MKGDAARVLRHSTQPARLLGRLRHMVESEINGHGPRERQRWLDLLDELDECTRQGGLFG